MWCPGLSLCWFPLLQNTNSTAWVSVAMVHRHSCSAACGISQDQGSNLCPVHQQADSSHQGSPGGPAVKNPPTMQETRVDVGSIPGLGRSSGGGNGNLLQYSCLENPRDRGAWWATVLRLQSQRVRGNLARQHAGTSPCLALTELEVGGCSSEKPR